MAMDGTVEPVVGFLDGEAVPAICPFQPETKPPAPS
jgi:hypothetical protein